MEIEPILILIAVFVLLFVVIYEGITSFKKHTSFNPIPLILLLIGILFAIVVYYRGNELVARDWAEILLTIGLLTVTAAYAWSAERQANANVKMAEEMRDQRVMASRPVIIIKVVPSESIVAGADSDYFEIYNAGNGTAIEVEVVLVFSREPPYEPRHGQRESFLRAGDTPIIFYPNFPKDMGDSTFYIVSEYQGIYSYSIRPKWYQTWLPCKLSVSRRVIFGKLEFVEVTEDKRIGLFQTDFDSKPHKEASNVPG